MSDEILSLIYTFSSKFSDPETNLSFDPKNHNISAVVKEGNVNISLFVKDDEMIISGYSLAILKIVSPISLAIHCRLARSPGSVIYWPASIHLLNSPDNISIFF